MFNFNDINNYVFYLTGHKDLIAPRPIKRFPATVEKRISQVRRRKLKTYTDGSQIFLIFHEFCHFTESEGEDLFAPNFGLAVDSKSRVRETRVRVIQNVLSKRIGEFSDKTFNYGSHTPCSYQDFFSIFSCCTTSDDPLWEYCHRKALEKNSSYRDFDFLVDRLKSNIKLLKERT